MHQTVGVQSDFKKKRSPPLQTRLSAFECTVQPDVKKAVGLTYPFTYDFKKAPSNLLIRLRMHRVQSDFRKSGLQTYSLMSSKKRSPPLQTYLCAFECNRSIR